MDRGRLFTRGFWLDQKPLRCPSAHQAASSLLPTARCVRGRRRLLSAGDGFYKHRTKGCCRDENRCGAEILGQSNRLTFKNLAEGKRQSPCSESAETRKMPARTMFAAGGLARKEESVTKNTFGGNKSSPSRTSLKPNVENRARKSPKASKCRLNAACTHDVGGRRRLLSAEGGNGHALALFELYSSAS